MSPKPWGARRLVRGLWVRVMRGMCPNGFTVAVKGAVLGTRMWLRSGGGGGGGGWDATCSEEGWENGKWTAALG